MQVKIDVDASKFEKWLDYTKQIPRDFLEIGAEALYDFLIEYHSRIDWKEGRWFAGGRSGEFQRQVIQGWQKPVVSGNTVEIKNTFGLLRWKTTGGTITPQRASHLTIPLIPQARGLLVDEYSSTSGQRLFRAGQALCRKVGKKVEAVYALSLGVKQSPYPDAMPSEAEMSKVVMSSLKTVVKRIR
jgi:hypothetical protein